MLFQAPLSNHMWFKDKAGYLRWCLELLEQKEFPLGQSGYRWFQEQKMVMWGDVGRIYWARIVHVGSGSTNNHPHVISGTKLALKWGCWQHVSINLSYQLIRSLCYNFMLIQAPTSNHRWFRARPSHHLPWFRLLHDINWDEIFLFLHTYVFLYESRSNLSAHASFVSTIN
jgi:hypothetical protein